MIKPANVLKEVMRNKNRILNHGDLLRKKIALGRELKLFPDPASTVDPRVEVNLGLLKLLRARRISATEALAKISAGLMPAQTEAEITHNMVNAYLAGQVELHLTDRCNCRCPGCYYGSQKKDVFPFQHLSRVGEMQPRSIVLVGGGEPTIYQSGGRELLDSVLELESMSPGIQFGLITNGIAVPEQREELFSRLRWVRLSIDAATQSTYEIIKGREVHAIGKTIDNLKAYLDSDIPFVGAGFLFSSLNIHESLDFLQLIYSVAAQRQKWLDRINIQFRPMRPSTEIFEGVSRGTLDFKYAIKGEQIDAIRQQHDALMGRADANFADFIKTKTNTAELFKGNTSYVGEDFDFCSYAFLYRLIRPSGNVYPCFVSIDLEKAENTMGNILRDNDYRLRVGLLSYLYASKVISYCSKNGCRLSRNNHIPSAAATSGQFVRPSGSAHEDYFF